MTKKEMLSAIQILEEKNKKLKNDNEKLKNDNEELRRKNGHLNMDIASCSARMVELGNKNETLNGLVEERDREIAKIIELMAAVPTDCEQSELCYACIFGVEYLATVRQQTPFGNLTPSTHRFMVCKRDEFKCKSFKQKGTGVETK